MNGSRKPMTRCSRRVAATLLPLIACVALASAIPAACAEPVDYAPDPQFTRVHWEVRHFGTSTIRGRFDRLEGAITLDREKRRGEVSIVVDTGSISTGIAPFDTVLRDAELLASAAFPKAYFVSRDLVFDGERLVALNGEITLRGISQPLRLQAQRFVCRPVADAPRERCGGDFVGELRRSDFGMTVALPFAADRVRLQIEVEGLAR